MKSVEQFVPAAGDVEVSVLLHQARDCPLLPPFHESLIDFVGSLSKSILLDRDARRFPELVVLANFFRTAKLREMAGRFREGDLSVPRGVVFHMAPANVDSVFLYSSLLSLLCGNVNVVRVSRGVGEQMRYVFGKLNALLAGRHAALSGRFVVFTYEHDDELTSLISAQCQMRVVWGGDATVRKIRAVPLRPTATELCFPDRFSAAMFRADGVTAIDDAALDALCSGFFNDSMWFSQQACSSPRLVAWIGTEAASSAARQRFWRAFQSCLEARGAENTSGMAFDRFVSSCLVATSEAHVDTSSWLFPSRLEIMPGPLGHLRDLHCGNGLFFEQVYPDVGSFFRSLTDKEQTLSVFGYSADDIRANADLLSARALDRVTQVGSALAFDTVWDGIDLLQAFTRYLSITL